MVCHTIVCQQNFSKRFCPASHRHWYTQCITAHRGPAPAQHQTSNATSHRAGAMLEGARNTSCSHLLVAGHLLVLVQSNARYTAASNRSSNLCQNSPPHHFKRNRTVRILCSAQSASTGSCCGKQCQQHCGTPCLISMHCNYQPMQQATLG